MRIETLPFWERLLESNLLEPAQLSIVRAEVNRWKESQLRAEAGGGDEAWLGLAQQRLQAWLVDHDLLTEYQAQVLSDQRLGGGDRANSEDPPRDTGERDTRRSTGRPLELGPWRLVDQVLDWGLPHHYWAGNHPRVAAGFLGRATGVSGAAAADLTHENNASRVAMLAFGQGLGREDWEAVRARVARLVGLRDPLPSQVIVPWATVTQPPYCAVLLPPCCAAEADAADGWRAQSLSQRMSPAVVALRGGPSTKRVLQWAGELAAGLQSLHALDLPLGAINPASVLVTAGKRVAWWAVPVSYLRVPGLASNLWGLHGPGHAGADSGGVGRRSAGSTRDPLAGLAVDFRSSQPQGWSVLDFLPPEQVPPEQVPPEPVRSGRTDKRGGSLAEASTQRVVTPATAAGDCYAFGVLLYWLLTGQVPAAGKDAAARVAAKQSAGDWPWPDSIPRQVRQCVLPLLAADPGARPSDLSGFLAALQSLLKQELQPLGPLFELSPGARQWEVASRQWPGAEWTPAQSAVLADELPAFSKTVAAPEIVVDTGRATPTLKGGDQAVATLESGGGPGSVAVVEAGGVASVRKLRQGRAKPLRWNSPPILTCIVSAAATGVVLVGWWLSGAGNGPVADSSNLAQEAAAPTAVPEIVENGDVTPTGWTQELVADDGRLLWESPTVGLPLEVAFLPTNPTGLVVLERGFWNSPALEPWLAALEGPVASGAGDAVRQWRERLGVDRFSRAWLGIYPSSKRVDYAVLLEVDPAQPPAEVSLAGWKLIARLEHLESPAVLATSPNEGVVDAEVAAGTDSPAGDTGRGGERSDAAEGGKLQHFLVAQAGPTGILAGWLQLEQIPADWPADLPLAAAQRVVPAMFDPAEAEVEWEGGPVIARRWVVGTPELIQDVIANAGQTEVSGPMANLLTFSDRQRQLQCFFNPVSLWNAEGREWLGGRWQWLGQLVKDHVPAAVRMMGLSVHVLPGGETYVEAKFAVDRAQSAATVMAPLVEDLQEMPAAAKRGLLDLPRIAYWENILLRYDNMLTDVSGQVRLGQHDRLPTLNAWLRPRALDNLWVATETYFSASQLGQGELPWWADGQTVGPPVMRDPAANGVPASLAELLRLPRSLSIPEQDLINALKDLETEIKTEFPQLGFDFSIVVDGSALRVEGITQNQKITNFEQDGQPLAEILTAMVLKANPDPAVTSPRDPACKLIWLIDPGRPDGQIRITTRAAAAEQGWALPPQVAVE